MRDVGNVQRFVANAATFAHDGEAVIGRREHVKLLHAVTFLQADHLQAAPFGYNFHFAQREGEQAVVRGSQHDFAVGVDEGRQVHAHRRQHGFAVVQRHHGFACFQARMQVFQFADKAVAARIGKQVVVFGFAGEHGNNLRIGGHVDKGGKGHAVAASFGDVGGVDGVAAAGVVQYDDGLNGACGQDLLQAVAFFEHGLGNIDIVPRTCANPALLRQNQRNGFVCRGLCERGAFGGFHQRAPCVAELFRISLHFFDNVFFLGAFIAQQGVQAALFFAQFV